MKKFCICLLAVLLLKSTACAEVDISTMTLEELYLLRDEVNAQITTKIKESYVPPEGKTIAELFPDPYLAKVIRDEVGAFSTKNVITQEELDKITGLHLFGNPMMSLEGVQYLRNLGGLHVYNRGSISEIPDWIGNLINLEYLTFSNCPISKVPDSICNLVNLRTLDLGGTNISALPENIGNLSNLKELDISYTNITELPESIYGLKLDEFNREGLDLD